MTPAERPDMLEEPTIAAFDAGGPANDTAGSRDALASGALLRLGAALMVAGAAVVVGVLMAAVAVRVRI